MTVTAFAGAFAGATAASRTIAGAALGVAGGAGVAGATIGSSARWLRIAANTVAPIAIAAMPASHQIPVRGRTRAPSPIAP